MTTNLMFLKVIFKISLDKKKIKNYRKIAFCSCRATKHKVTTKLIRAPEKMDLEVNQDKTKYIWIKRQNFQTHRTGSYK